jgi:hypothetical protein
MKSKFSCPTCKQRPACDCAPPDYARMRRESEHAPSTAVYVAALQRAWEHRAMMLEADETRDHRD